MSEPIQKGDTVTIPKGTYIRSTHPTRSAWAAGRTYKVKINHVLGPVRVAIGYRSFDAEGKVSYESMTGVDRHTKPTLEALYGTSDPEQLRDHLTEFTRYDRPDGTSYCSLMVETYPAKVVWAGTGGYWCEVPTKAARK